MALGPARRPLSGEKWALAQLFPLAELNGEVAAETTQSNYATTLSTSRTNFKLPEHVFEQKFV